MDVFQLCQHVSTIESTIEFLFGTEMLSASFNCHLCGTECTLVEEEEDEESEAPRSPNTKGHVSPTKKKSTPKKSSPKKSPRGSPKGGGSPMKSPTRRQFSLEDEEASVRSIAYASVLGGAAAAARVAAAKNAHSEFVTSSSNSRGVGTLQLSIPASNECAEKDKNDSSDDDDEEEEESEEEEDSDEDEEDEAMKVSDTDRFWWCCPRCDEAFSIRTDSMFEASKLPLQRLVVMVYCFSTKVPRAVAASLAGVTPEDLDTWYEACHGVIDLLDSEGEASYQHILTDELRALQASQRDAERAHVHLDTHGGDEHSPEKRRGEGTGNGFGNGSGFGGNGSGSGGNGSGNGSGGNGSGNSGGSSHNFPSMCAACGANVITGVVPEAPDEWKKKADGIGELELAEQETDVAEGEYDRLLYEEGQISSELRDLKDYKLESALRKIKRVVSSSQDFEQLDKLVLPIKNLPLLTQYSGGSQIDTDTDLPGSQEESELDLSVGSQSQEIDDNKSKNLVARSLNSLVTVSKKRDVGLVSKAIDSVESNIQARISTLEKIMTKVEKDKDKALANVETWRARQLEAPNYDEVMKRRERDWLDAEMEENKKCLIEMRKYLPQNVSKLSKFELQQNAKEAGDKLKESLPNKAKTAQDVSTSLLGIYPSDLAIYFKECSFLHWLVMHPTDIRKSNFLLGDSSQHFQNLEKYDIVELRAVAAVLPESFEFDQDGRKADWKASFLTRLKTLTQQQERAKVTEESFREVYLCIEKL